ncbi:MAG: YigZ family protein [Tissierellia bacterium]|nr:YigZ family protein [Tissierellia bacterium]
MKIRQEYFTLGSVAETEFEIKKSVFISRGFPISSEEEAQEITAKIKENERQATHHCSAYIVGLNMNTQRFFDDGEPSGTAGMPILDVMKKEGITNALIVVTRYFGGVKLGAGGLIRAYSQGAVEAVKVSKKVLMKDFFKVSLSFDYTLHGKIENWIMNKGIHVENQNFSDCVEIEIWIDGNDFENVRSELMDMSSGTATITMIGSEYVPTIDGVALL